MIGNETDTVDNQGKRSVVKMKLRGFTHQIDVKVHKIVNSSFFSFAIVLVFILTSSLYHYGLLCEYPPNGEDLTAITGVYSCLATGVKYQVGEILLSVSAFIATKICGMTYFASRLQFTLLYMILLALTVFLCLSSKKRKKKNIYLVPLIGLFAVILFPPADRPVMFWYSGGEGLAYLWPFIYHYSARIYTLMCLAWIWCLMRCKEKRGRIIYGVLLAVTCLYAMKMTDLIFYAMFLAPAVIVLILHLLWDDKFRKYVIFLFIGGMICLLCSRILPISMIGQWWTKEYVDSVYGTVYGGTNWIAPDVLIEHLLSYIEIIFLFFNIQISSAPVISLYTFIYIFKIGILIVGYIFIFHIIMCSLTGKGKEYHYDCVDEIAAWSFLILSGIYIFTELGITLRARYFPGFTAMMTIVLCRNLETFPGICKIDVIQKIKYKKIMLCVCTFVLCVCSAGKVWAYHAPNQFDDELMAMIEYIQMTDYGYVLAPHWIYSRVSALSEGQIMAYEHIDEDNDTKFAYIITHNDDYWYDNIITFYPNCETYQDMCEYYSKPSDVIRYNKLQLVIYEDGIHVKD